MNQKLKKFIMPAGVLFALNCFFLWRIFLNKGFSGEFKGYAIGAGAAVMFAFSWIFIAEKIITAPPIKAFKIIGIAFAVKLALLCLILYCGWNIPFFFPYLGMAFSIGAMGTFLLGIFTLKIS